MGLVHEIFSVLSPDHHQAITGGKTEKKTART
jgi:hypothetical protein